MTPDEAVVAVIDTLERLEVPYMIVGSLASKTERKLLMPGGSNAKYANGFLTFMRAGTLVAQPFDAARLTLSSLAGQSEIPDTRTFYYRPLANQLGPGWRTRRTG